MPMRSYILHSLVNIALVLLLFTAAIVPVAARETISIWVPGGGAAVWGVYAETAAKFVEKHGYKAEVLPVEGDYYQVLDKILVSQLGGLSVDLILTVDYTGGEYIQSDLYTNLMPFVAKDNFDLGAFPRFAVDVFHVPSRDYLYALPVGLGTSALFYLPEKFDNVGAAPPPADWTNDGWTWDEFVTTSRKLRVDRNADGNWDELALARWLVQEISPLQWGVDFTDATGSKSLLDNPRLHEALDEGLRLTTEHQVVFGPGVPTSGPGGWDAFFTRRAAMMPAWDESAAAMYQQLTDGLQVGVYPQHTTRQTRVSVFGWAVGKTSANKEAVWRILADMATSEEAAIDTLRRGGRIPAYTDAIMSSLAYYEDAYPGLDAMVFMQPMLDPTLQAVQPWRYNSNGRKINQLINSAIHTATTGEKPVSNALLEVHPLVDELLREGHVGLLD